MKLYLDLCALKRPYDPKTGDLVLLEALSVAGLVEEAEAGNVEIVSSAILEAENSRNPDPIRRAGVALLLASFNARIDSSSSIVERARVVHALGFSPADALHVASAEAGGCDVLVTTDHRMLEYGRKYSTRLYVKIADPVEVVRMLEGTAQ